MTCGEGLAQADGEDYHISDCKPGNLLEVGGGLIISYTYNVLSVSLHLSHLLRRRLPNAAMLNDRLWR